MKSSRLRPYRLEALESRGLLSAGLTGSLNVIEDLGEVSKALATQGVEVTASIPAHSSVTFQFGAEAAGDYTLKVRYTGDGLTLKAQGPSGSSNIVPGPAGPFSSVGLTLKAAEYEITATAVGDSPVFVDWELLLNAGVGQSAAVGTTLSAPSSSSSAAVAVPNAVSTSSTPTALAVPTAGSTASASTSTSSPASTSNASANWGPAVSPSMVTTGGLAGRPEPTQSITPVGPSSPNGALALAFAGDTLPEGALSALGSVAKEAEVATPFSPSSPTTPLLVLEALGNGQRDQEVLELPSWFNRLFEMHGTSKIGPDLAKASQPGSVEGQPDQAIADAGDQLPAALAASVEPSVEPPGVNSTVIASPGLIACVVMLTSAAHRWRPGRGLFTKRRKSKAVLSQLPQSMS